MLAHKVRNSEHLPSWRVDLNSMSKKWAAALANNIPGIEHDVKFLLGEDQKPISCHKLVLSVCSPVFQAMFSAPFKSVEEVMTTIEVPGVNFSGMTNVLKYAYTGEINVNLEDALTTMYSANKYDIPEIFEHCSGLLKSNLSIGNAVTIYQSAVVLGDTDLMTAAEKYIVQNFQNIMNTSDFLRFGITNLNKFIQMDGLNVYSEIDLFNGILKWAKHQCSKLGNKTTQGLKDVMCGLVKHIRFPTMSALEFAKKVEPTGILSDKDCCNLFRYFSLAEKDRLSLTMNYNKRPRMTILEIIVWFWNKSHNRRPQFYPKLRTGEEEFRKESFRILPLSAKQAKEVENRNSILRLKGICLLAPQHGHIQQKYDNPFDVIVTLSSQYLSHPSFHHNTGEVHKAKFNYTVNPGEFYQLTFAKPIEMLPDREYSFSVEYIKGTPGDIYSPLPKNIVCNPDGSKSFQIQHTSGHHIVAAMKILL